MSSQDAISIYKQVYHGYHPFINIYDDACVSLPPRYEHTTHDNMTRKQWCGAKYRQG